MRRSVFRETEKAIRKNKRTRQRHAACSYPSLRGFRTHYQDKALSNLERDPHLYTRRVKKAIHIRTIQITSIKVVESKFLKHGFPQSRSTAADR